MTATISDQSFEAIAFGDCTRNWQPGTSAAIGASVTTGGDARVRLTRLRPRPGRRTRMSLSVHSTTPFHSLVFRLRPGSAPLPIVRRLADAILLESHATAKELVVAMASGSEIRGDGRPLVIFEWHTTATRTALPFATTAVLDDRPVRVVHRAR